MINAKDLRKTENGHSKIESNNIRLGTQQEQASKPLHSLLDKGVTNCNQQEVSCMVDLGSFCPRDQPIIFEKFE